MNLDDVKVKEKFEKQEYTLDSIPRLVLMNHTGVYVNKNAPYPNEIESLENFDFEKSKIKFDQLQVKSYGCWQLAVAMISSKYFESRAKFDELYTNEVEIEHIDTRLEKADRISIAKAFESMFNVKMSLNLELYKKNKNVMEYYLNCNVNKMENKSLNQIKENEMFYEEMSKIFVFRWYLDEDQNTKEKTHMLTNFRMLFNDGNSKLATAERNGFFLIFDYLY
ncbi:unnamed protein product [Brachionus calyciflorus]|uniref:Uncharacterized protein n=1 Tax=Brachionus calyciflorus TaxID=104777 RepID=A0A814M5M0_9BILA|nr:unnamed protein product [Brachionus calyciflorus]